MLSHGLTEGEARGGPRCISEAPCGVAQGWPAGHLLSLDAPQRCRRGDEQGTRRRGEPVWAVWRRRWRILLSPQSPLACTVGLSPCTARSRGDRCSKATLGACPRDFHQQSRALQTLHPCWIWGTWHSAAALSSCLPVGLQVCLFALCFLGAIPGALCSSRIKEPPLALIPPAPHAGGLAPVLTSVRLPASPRGC